MRTLIVADEPELALLAMRYYLSDGTTSPDEIACAVMDIDALTIGSILNVPEESGRGYGINPPRHRDVSTRDFLTAFEPDGTKALGSALTGIVRRADRIVLVAGRASPVGLHALTRVEAWARGINTRCQVTIRLVRYDIGVLKSLIRHLTENAPRLEAALVDWLPTDDHTMFDHATDQVDVDLAAVAPHAFQSLLNCYLLSNLSRHLARHVASIADHMGIDGFPVGEFVATTLRLVRATVVRRPYLIYNERRLWTEDAVDPSQQRMFLDAGLAEVRSLHAGRVVVLNARGSRFVKRIGIERMMQEIMLPETARMLGRSGPVLPERALKGMFATSETTARARVVTLFKTLRGDYSGLGVGLRRFAFRLFVKRHRWMA